jgi:hypothetical protein
MVKKLKTFDLDKVQEKYLIEDTENLIKDLTLKELNMVYAIIERRWRTANGD